LLQRSLGKITCRGITPLLLIYSMDFLNPHWFAQIAVRSVLVTN